MMNSPTDAPAPPVEVGDVSSPRIHTCLSQPTTSLYLGDNYVSHHRL